MLSIHSSNSQAGHIDPQTTVGPKRSVMESTGSSLSVIQASESSAQELSIKTAEITGKGNLLDIKG